MDHIDIHVEVPAVPYKDLMAEYTAESSAAIKQRVAAACNPTGSNARKYTAMPRWAAAT